MFRYFIEVSYLGTAYNGFQIQENGPTIQSQIDAGLNTLLRQKIETTGSSRTDSGVHARQNFLHFDIETPIPDDLAYKMNAILPRDIAVNGIYAVEATLHSRFAAQSREYAYTLFTHKDPFMRDRGFYYPFPLRIDLLQESAQYILTQTDFTSFSKRNTQVHTFNCSILNSYWEVRSGQYIYHVCGNRFLRGMVRGLVGTMLRVGRGRMSMNDFKKVFEAQDCSKADFAVPGAGLTLMRVRFPEGSF
jgi:tRNA pseudouridine38-40 synthase